MLGALVGSKESCLPDQRIFLFRHPLKFPKTIKDRGRAGRGLDVALDAFLSGVVL